MRATTRDGIQIAWDDAGPRSSTALLCLPGWCVPRSFFADLAPRLARRHRILTLDWRGHGDSDAPPNDFGHAELVADALAVIEAAGVDRVIPIAQAHGGWVALELARLPGPRVNKIVATSWLVLDPPPPFLGALEALQDPARTTAARDQLFAMWTAGAPDGIAAWVHREMGSFDAAMWARGARSISADYRHHGSPLRALSAAPTVELLHLFSQPRVPEALAAQEAFAREHRWFSVSRLDAVSHFPPLEVPDATAEAIDRFVS